MNNFFKGLGETLGRITALAIVFGVIYALRYFIGEPDVEPTVEVFLKDATVRDFTNAMVIGVSIPLFIFWIFTGGKK